MTEITPLLKQKSDVPRYAVASKTEGEVESSVCEAEEEIPLLEIVSALCSAWQRNGANEDLTARDIMAMNVQYRRVTHGWQVLHSPHAIMNELADAMLSCLPRTHFNNGDPHLLEKRKRILRRLRQNWTSVTKVDEDLAPDLNSYPPSTCSVRIWDAWMNCRKKCTDLQSSFSDFTFQLLLSAILLSWPLSVLIMGAKFKSQCPIDGFLPDVMVAAGVVGITALLFRLAVVVIEKWFWFPMRTVISSLRNALKFVEFVFLLVLAIQIGLSFEHSSSFESEDHNFCNETFYTFTFWMKHISTPFAVVWMVAYVVKAVLWVKRIRYHYMPPFCHDSEMNNYTETGR